MLLLLLPSAGVGTFTLTLIVCNTPIWVKCFVQFVHTELSDIDKMAMPQIGQYFVKIDKNIVCHVNRRRLGLGFGGRVSMDAFEVRGWVFVAVELEDAVFESLCQS